MGTEQDEPLSHYTGKIAESGGTHTLANSSTT